MSFFKRIQSPAQSPRLQELVFFYNFNQNIAFLNEQINPVIFPKPTQKTVKKIVKLPKNHRGKKKTEEPAGA